MGWGCGWGWGGGSTFYLVACEAVREIPLLVIKPLLFSLRTPGTLARESLSMKSRLEMIRTFECERRQVFSGRHSLFCLSPHRTIEMKNMPVTTRNGHIQNCKISMCVRVFN